MKTHLIKKIAGLSAAAIAITMVISAAGAAPSGKSSLHRSLKALPVKIAWECYVNGNWEIFVMNADGSRPVNLTNTPDQNEHYPQVSPDGKRIAFTVDSGEGREAVRSL